MHARRAVITGMGVVGPAGSTVPGMWDNLVNGRSGIGSITRFDAAAFGSRIAGEVEGWVPADHFSDKDLRRIDEFQQYGMVAARQAVTDAGLEPERLDLDRVGVIVASGVGGLRTVDDSSKILDARGPRKMSPFCIAHMIIDMLSGAIAIEYGFRGPNFGYVSACASAAHSIGEAGRMIRHGDADLMIAGGSEAPVTPLGVGGFGAMRALSTRNHDPQAASRPFDRDRDGFVIAEGAGILVIEEYEHAKARGATIHAELVGYGRTCDAFHITAPEENGRGGAQGIRLALADAGLEPGDVDYINAHGTSTDLNDRCETLAIKAAFGEEAARNVAISSTKSMTGHLLGAGGGIEAIVSILAIRDNVVPPTTNLDHPSPDCDLDYVPHTAREIDVHTVLSNSLGFGGHNATLCFRAV